MPLFCHLSSVIKNVLYAECDNVETPYITSKSHWHYASDKQIHDYQTDLDIRLKLFTLPEGIITCKNPSTCSHRPQITTFHDKIVSTLNENMHTHISSASNKNKRTRQGWDAEMDYAWEESLYWHNIWIECDRPDSGIIYDIVALYRVFSLIRERADILSLIKKTLFLHSFYEITK